MHTLTPILAQVSENNQNAIAAAAAAFVAAFFLVFVVVGIVTLIGMWKTFDKAGQPGWAVLIPIYNIIVLLRIAGLPAEFPPLKTLGTLPAALLTTTS